MLRVFQEFDILPNPKFGCSLLKKSILRRQVLIGKEFEFYPEGQPPGEKADPFPKPRWGFCLSLRAFKGVWSS